MPTTSIAIATHDDDLRRCYPVMAELRPHLTEAQFVEGVRRQQASKQYRLVFLEVDKIVQAVAGFCVLESLAWGRFLYVDDLVTAAPAQGRGHGRRLFEWLLAQAKAEDCDQFHLDSGVHRFAAHRFYFANRLEINCHHFGLKLK